MNEFCGSKTTPPLAHRPASESTLNFVPVSWDTRRRDTLWYIQVTFQRTKTHTGGWVFACPDQLQWSLRGMPLMGQWQGANIS